MFLKLQRAITEAPVLALPDFKSLIVGTDESKSLSGGGFDAGGSPPMAGCIEGHINVKLAHKSFGPHDVVGRVDCCS